MKRLSITLCLLTAVSGALGASTRKAQDKHPLMSSDTVVWAGLDYSMVRMVGPGDFRDPEAIFPGMPDKWNALFLKEMIGKTGDALRKRVIVDTGGMAERNRLATPKQIIPNGGPDDAIDKSHVTPPDIANAVRSYKLESQSGLGLTFIVDRLVKPNKRGAVYIVFFDVATREVISSQRRTYGAGGAGFRNYWFRVVKAAVPNLSSYR